MGEPVPQSIDFDAVPFVGTVVMLKGQRYELVRLEPYIRKDGTLSTLLIWSSRCPVCDDPFEVKSALKGEPNRRCPEHRSPGTKVSAVSRQLRDAK